MGLPLVRIRRKRHRLPSNGSIESVPESAFAPISVHLPDHFR